MRARRVLFWLLLIALAAAALTRLGEIERVLRLFLTLRWPWVAAAVGAQVLIYAVTVWSLQAIVAALGYAFPSRQLWRPGVAMYLGWKTLPGGGVGGLALWSVELANRGVPHSVGAASALVYWALDYLAFLILLVLAEAALFGEHAMPRAIALSVWLGGLIVLLVAGGVVASLRSEQRGIAAAERVVGWANRVLGWVHRGPVDPKPIRNQVTLFYEVLRGLRGRWRRLLRPTLFMLSARCLDILTIQVLFWATGHHLAWSAATLGFVYASVASGVSLLPSGIGVMDASLAILYAALGAPLSTAVVVTLLYRALAYWLPIPYGLYLYRHLVVPAERPNGSASEVDRRS